MLDSRRINTVDLQRQVTLLDPRQICLQEQHISVHYSIQLVPCLDAGEKNKICKYCVMFSERRLGIIITQSKRSCDHCSVRRNGSNVFGLFIMQHCMSNHKSRCVRQEMELKLYLWEIRRRLSILELLPQDGGIECD